VRVLSEASFPSKEILTCGDGQGSPLKNPLIRRVAKSFIPRWELLSSSVDKPARVAPRAARFRGQSAPSQGFSIVSLFKSVKCPVPPLLPPMSFTAARARHRRQWWAHLDSLS